MRKVTIFLSFIFLSLFSISIAAQTKDAPSPSDSEPEEDVAARKERQIQQAQVGASQKKGNEKTRSAQKEPGRLVNRNLSPFSIEPNRKQRKLLLPDSVDSAKYAAFLERPKTGLIKLFPDVGCEENARVIRVDNECLNWIPTSAFYSFREREHSREFLSDIKLINNSLVSNGFLSQGILVALGNVPLENISLATDGMKYLVDYKPAVYSREALKQFNTISRGVRVGKYIYRNDLPALENMTYALRVVAYRGNAYRTFQGRLFDILEGDERVDLIVALRVLKKDSRGIVTLLWKEINRTKSPKAIFKTSADKTPSIQQK